VNQVRAGVVDIMITGTSIWTNVVPELGIFDLGYVFQDYDHMLRASATPAGAGPARLGPDRPPRRSPPAS
ncbi:MAG: hypothetical protein JJE27_05910, partial [Thermoleophilia bacterium]|nr:hypothetical protein [Thermoleophilia bacterium]